MKKKRNWDDFLNKVLNVCSKLIIPATIIWAITVCAKIILIFTT